MSATIAGCQFDVDRGPDWLMIKVRRSKEDPLVYEPMGERLWHLLEQHFTYRLVLEMDQAAALTSEIIAQLIRLQKRIDEHGGTLRLCGLSPHNQRVLRTCALEDRLPAYESREQAVRGDPRLPR